MYTVTFTSISEKGKLVHLEPKIFNNINLYTIIECSNHYNMLKSLYGSVRIGGDVRLSNEVLTFIRYHKKELDIINNYCDLHDIEY